MMYVIPVIIITILFNLPKFHEVDLVLTDHNITNVMSYENGTSTETNVTIKAHILESTKMRDNPTYIKFYINFADNLVHGLGPFAALAFFNVKIYKRFIRTKARYSRKKHCRQVRGLTPSFLG